MPYPKSAVADLAKNLIDQNRHNESQPQPLRMVMDTARLWQPGQTLRIKFLNGSRELRDRTKSVIERVYQPLVYLNLDFVIAGESDIRISFDTSYSTHSYVGTDARSKSPHEYTMNLGITTSTPQETFQRVVLHEFGHALGGLHEHSSPNCPIEWDQEKVYRWFKNNRGWDEKSVDLNVLCKESSAAIHSSQFDPTSIMMYPFEPDLTKNGPFTQVDSSLSETDKRFVSGAYPKPTEGQISSIALAYVPRFPATFPLSTRVRRGSTTW